MDIYSMAEDGQLIMDPKDPSLQQYESSLYKFKDERDAIQKKTFTKWVNKHLKKANKHVSDLFEDLQDGHNLISLLEVLSGELLPREKGRMRFHKLQNVQIALDFLKFRKIKLVNIRPDDIVDGNPKLTLGLIWTIILHFQISDIIFGQTDESLSAREALLRWAQRTTDRYPGVKVTDFTSSWRDGLAFNSLIHRNRPDMFEFRSLRTRAARENLDHAFSLLEQEFGVTRLLDIEDVDTAEPDEKSLITYISSVYDVFPDPPAYNPFGDDDKVRRVEDYKDFSTQLYRWMRQSMTMLEDRNFPNSLIEMKAILSDCTRFRVEEVPPKLRDKQRLSHLYRDIQKSFKDINRLDIEDQLHFENLERFWNRLMSAHQERDQLIREEITRLERLQRLAEKVHREAKQCDGKLDDVERKVIEEEKRMQRLHQTDAKHNCDQIDIELKHIEDSIKSMLKDVTTLREGRYHQAPELHKRVQQLHERFVNIRLIFQTRLLNQLTGRPYKVEERKVTKQRQVVTEQRLVETNRAFQFLQECIDWVTEKLKTIDEAEYGSDLPSVQSLLSQHHIEHKLIDNFQKNVDQCLAQKNQFKAEEHEMYCKLLTRLEKGYSELLVLSNKRLSDLESLLDFIQAATQEIMWMNEKEEIEVSRDWSSKNINLVSIEQYQEQFTSELESREIKLNTVQVRGETLINQRHPASKFVEAYLMAMQSQWSWLLQLTSCLDTHLKHSSNYHQFFNEAKECQQWLHRIEEKLNSTYNKINLGLDEGERLIEEMQEVRDDLTRYGDIVSSLIQRSKTIVPLKQRRQPLPRPLRVQAICTYKQLNMAVGKDEQCWLHDNVQKIKWKVINSNGTEGMVPGVCFVIPPPCQEALELAESLKLHYDAVVQLWTKKQHKLRLNMILATIKIVMSWDLEEFRNMIPSQRESIMKALNEDTQKLLSEGDRDDPALKKLEEEMKRCNKHFLNLMNLLEMEEADNAPNSPRKLFNNLVASLQNTLNDKEKLLSSRVQSQIPRNLDMLENLVVQHKEFEMELQGLEPQIEEVKELFQAIYKKTSILQSRLDSVLATWERIWSISHLYVDRLKCVEIALNHLDEATQSVANLELELASYENLPSDLDSLREIHDRLLTLQNQMQRQHQLFDQLIADTTTVRLKVEKTRPKQYIHPDVDKLEEDVRKVTRRWENVGIQLVERLRSCGAASELLMAYKNNLESEQDWLNKMTNRFQEIKSIHEIEPALDLYSSLADRKPAIDQVNLSGARFIREAKQAADESRITCSQLLSWLDDLERQLGDLGLLRENTDELHHQINNAKSIKDELDNKQRQVYNCLDEIRQVCHQGQDILNRDEIEQLQKDGDHLKKRYTTVNNESEKLLRRLNAAFEELRKFSMELHNFNDWLTDAHKTLSEKERALADLKNINTNSISYRTFASDVISHQADLRFITMAGQKVLDESKDYLKALNDLRTNLPRRLSHLEPSDSQIKSKVQDATTTYHNLLNQANKLGDRYSSLEAKQRLYADSLEKAVHWLNDAQHTARKLLDEPVAGEPRIIQDQLDRVRALSTEIVAQGRLIETAKHSARSLLDSLEGVMVSASDRRYIEEAIVKLENSYQQLAKDINERSNELQTALIFSQDVQAGLDRLLHWLDESDVTFRNISRPVSLIKEKLEDQMHEHRLLQSDLDSQKPSIDALNASARDLLESSNQKLARKVESKIKDLNTRFDKIYEKAHKRWELLEEVHATLDNFDGRAEKFLAWFTRMTEKMDIPRVNIEAMIDEISREKLSKQPEFDEMIKIGKNLVAKKDVTDTTYMKERMRQLEQTWRDLGILLDEKSKILKSRAEQLSAYEQLRAKVMEWLLSMETKVDRLETVALEKDTLRRQAMELKPLIKEHTDYAPVIDKVNDLGQAYDLTLRGESPASPTKRMLRSSSPTSPTRKSPPKSRRSPDGASKAASPLSNASSGFSSRHSSSDNLGTLEDLTPIQQQLSEINHRYGLIGVKLSDRQNEITSLTDEVRNYQDTLKALSSFIQSKERQLPKDGLPANKDQADKQLHLIKGVQEEIQEHQHEVDQLKIQTMELFKRKPNVQGVEILQQQVTELVNKWTDVCVWIKEKLAFLQDFKDFQDTHDLLSNWLSQKDKMFQVLGPIASEPRMVNSQIQQVQVMRDEFTSQQPLLNRFDKSGQATLRCMEPSSGKKVRDQMDTIHRHWDDLIGLLSERERNLDAATGAARDFHKSLMHLQDNLQRIDDEFEHLSGLDVDQHLSKLNALDDQLEKQRPLLADVTSMGQHLCDILSDAASKNEIKNKLNSLEKLYNNLIRKINNKKAELESSLREDREFFQTCDILQDWLNNIEHDLSHDLKISANATILKQQIQDYEPVYRQILDKEHEIHMLVSKGSDTINKLSRKSEAKGLSNKLDQVKKQWEKVRKSAVNNHTRLQRASENSRKFQSSLDSFIPWIEQTDAKVSSLKPINFHKVELDKQIKEIQSIKNEVSRHSQENENVAINGENLLSSCDTDKEPVRAELMRLKKLWELLNSLIFERNQALDDVSRKLAEYQDKYRDVNHTLHRLEDKATSVKDSSRDPKQLETMKGLLSDAQDVAKQLDRLKELAGTLRSEAASKSDISHISDEVAGLEKRQKQLVNLLSERCHDLASASEVVTQFTNKIKSIHLDLNKLEEDLEKMGPLARDINTVNTQISEIRDFSNELATTRDVFEEAEIQCQNIISHGYTPDSKGCKNQIVGLQRQLSRLEEKAKSRESNLTTMLSRLQQFYEDYSSVSRDLNNLIQEEQSFKLVAGEVDMIRIQQKEFKAFVSKKVEPFKSELNELNKSGQTLIQSASTGVSTNQLEHDLEKLNERWNTLKEKLSDRERKLDIALLQSGKFQEALEGVEKWLQDTEEMVANQKPPSADYKVVKAQLQEQKFLNKLLRDRQHSMSSLMAMGSEVMQNLSPSDRAQIEEQLANLDQRFEELINGAHERTDALEKTIPIAKDFQSKLGQLGDWLEGTEKRLGAMSTIATDKEKLRRQMSEHGALHEDILGHKSAFEDLTEIAQSLMGLVGDDEAQMVVEKLQDVTDRFARLVEESENIGQLLEDAYQGLDSFLLHYEDLMAWIEEMAARLSRHHGLSVYLDKLHEQLEELMELSEEITDHHKQIDDVESAGQDLMKHASGNDVIQMKDKLDSLQTKFNDLTGRAADRLRQAQDALPIVQNFHDAHDKLTSWMDEAERSLKTVETLAINAQESIIKKLELQVQEHRTDLETINHFGPQLCQICPGEGATVIESLITRDNRRFDAICEQVQRKAERIVLSKQRNVELVGDIDDLLEWFREVEKQMLEAEPLSPDYDTLAALLKEQKALNNEVSSQRGRVRDILSAAKKLMRESSADLSHIRDKAEDLKETSNVVASLCADRLSALEQALPLSEHFFETHAELSQWLDEIENETELLEAPALNSSQIKRQQEKNKAFEQSVKEHKPLVDKLNKTGIALMKLCADEESSKVQEILDVDNERYNLLKSLLRDRKNALEEALQATSQFADKLEGMLNALSNTADQVNNAEPISAHPERIQEQIGDNKAIIQDLEKRSSALDAVKRAADDVITKAKNTDEPAVRDIKKKLDKLNELWDTIRKSTRNRGKSLENALAAAERFWEELTSIMMALKDLQDHLNAQEPPAVEPSAIRQQKDVLNEIKQEIDQTKPEVDHCRQAGQNLMQLCGEPDKPEVKKHIEDLDNAWDNVTTLFAKREQNLIDAMEKAMNFHDILQSLLEFLDAAEEKFAHLGPVSSDIEAVKDQIDQLKDFKTEVDPHMVEVESLNRQAQELVERTSPNQARSIREPIADINHRWDDLLKGMVDRQRELENALLRLGQFQHALDELLVWISRTERNLDEVHPVFGDTQVIEVELAKHKVLMNDIQAHQTSVDMLNRAGRQLIDANQGSEESSVTQHKLRNLNNRWQALQDKAVDRQKELEEALKEAQIFNQEIQDLLLWLNDIDAQLVTSKPVGGLPETAREQLNRFMELFNDLDNNRHKVESVFQQGQTYMKKSTEGSVSNLQHNLKTLKQRWDNVLNRANDRKIKLEIALREATEFHEALQEFVDWLTNAEKYLTNIKPVSRIMNSVMEQIEEHKVFQKDVGAHREVMLNLDKKGTHLKYFSQKQDVILIKNLLISVQHRWERVVSKAAERTRALDLGYKETKEFHEAWLDLVQWLEEAEQSLDSTTRIGNDPEKIKQLLAKHKEFQRVLGAKQPIFDATMRMGRSLKDKCPKSDVPVLQEMMDELKNKWNIVCSKSVDRQRKLEEALLFSGQFKEAVQALIDWLDKAKAILQQDQFLNGDLDTVMALVDQHKAFQEELKSRSHNLDSVHRTASELLLTASQEDAQHIRSQMDLLERKWKEISNLSLDKENQLKEALKQAERLHKAVHMLLEWLSDAEMKLRFAGPLPDDEETTRTQIAEHQRFMHEMSEQEVNKDATISLAQEILQKCHPEGISVIRHWITIIQSRWEEVSVWAKQREQKLLDHLRSLRDILDLLEELMSWLVAAEATLISLEAEPLPDDLHTLESLIKDHQLFMDDMTKKQPDVEKVTKAFSSKRQPQQVAQQQTPSNLRDKRGLKLPLSSRTSTPIGNKAHAEPEIKHPRARELVDKWRTVWLLAMERQRRLQDKYNYLLEFEKIKNFDFDEWRKRFLGWLNNKKSRVMDLFRKIDKDNDGKVTQADFIDGILKSKFPTSRLEMDRVAEIFDRNSDGFIDHREYLDTLRPDRDAKPLTEAEKIQDEVQRQVAKCTCVHRFKVYQVGEGKYRFGESQKLRLVRILRSTVMVRVGGGWVALDEFLVKNDPCRAKGRTNLELREQFILAEGVSQSMSPFKPKASPNSSMSSQSGSIPSTGPITKVREKSERSVPMRRTNTSASDYSARSDSSTRTPRFTSGGPPSRSGSRPPSRANSDLSAESLDLSRGRRLTPGGSTQRTPSASSQTGRNATVKRTSSNASSIGRERWR